MNDSISILVIDDEFGIRFAISELLRTEGFEVTEAATAAEALKICTTLKPDIVLLDERLPDNSGIELFQQLKIICPQMLCCMITAYACFDVAVSATRQGIDMFLPKPFSDTELLETISTLTTTREQQRKAVRLEEEHNAKLQQLAAEKSRFIRTIVHELRSPLNSLKAVLDVAMDQSLGNSIDDYAELFQAATERINTMADIITDLLNLSKITAAPTADAPTIETAPAIENALKQLEPAIASKNLSVEKQLEPAVTLAIEPGDWELIINNLLSNAVKYNLPGGSIKISLTSENNLVKLAISDTGIGVSPEALGNLGTEFFREKSAATANIPGSGLGLSIVKQLSERQGGNLQISSTQGQGSTFIVQLPQAAH